MGYKCAKTTLKVNGKVNAITLDGCKKCAIVFTDVVASVELVNCSGVEVQAIGSVPSFAVDKCSTIQLVLSEACLKAEVVSAKSDQIKGVLRDACCVQRTRLRLCPACLFLVQ